MTLVTVLLDNGISVNSLNFPCSWDMSDDSLFPALRQLVNRLVDSHLMVLRIEVVEKGCSTFILNV